MVMVVSGDGRQRHPLREAVRDSFSERKLSEVTLLEVREIIAALLDRELSASTINATLQYCLRRWPGGA